MTDNIFHDDLVSHLRDSHAPLPLPSGRLVLLPDSFGFCQGVRGAVTRLTRTVAENPGRRIWLLGMMIHNPAVNDGFIRQGVTLVPEPQLDALFDHASPQDVFVVPAFGLPLDIDQRLHRFVQPPGCIVDTTCPFVRRVWQAVENGAKQGAAICIHGKPQHQETNAIWSRAAALAPAVAIIPTPEAATAFTAALNGDADPYPTQWLLHSERLHELDWVLVNQTTMRGDETRQVADILSNAPAHHGTCIQADTLCRATRTRQQDAVNLCTQRNCDIILVLGGTDSSNTTQLYRLAAQNTTTYFIQSPDDIHSDQIRHFLPATHEWKTSSDWLPPSVRVIGILGGASCPDSEIGKLIRNLQLFA